MFHENITYAKAINLAMGRAMEEDPNVFAFGIDLTDFKKTFGSGEGLIERYGINRYFGSPVSEAAATGVAIGAAQAGLRPIHVHARADFMLLAMNQLVNIASSKAYMSDGQDQLPMVVRCMIGRSWGQGAQHSKALHSTLAHFPGLKVVMPSNPQDAYSLLRSAIHDNSPVIFFEHRWLYDVIGDVDDELTVDIGDCFIDISTGLNGSLRPQITILATSWMVVEALEVQKVLHLYGIGSDVIDIRSIVPLDIWSIVSSVNISGLVIIADNDWTFCGFSSELSAQITEQCFDRLHKPPVRIGFAPTPCPTTRPLENAFYPSAIDIIRAAEKLLEIDPIDVSGVHFNDYENRFKGPF